MTTRNDVVAAARSWIGTPYHHHARVKGAGVDCGMLLIEVFSEAGALSSFDPGFYTRDWHFHRDEEKYLEFVDGYLEFVREEPNGFPGELLPGQVLVWKVGRTYSHGAIVTGAHTFVHASFPARVVEEISLVGSFLEGRSVRVYDFGGYEQ